MRTITVSDVATMAYPKNLFADGDTNTKLRKKWGKRIQDTRTIASPP